MVKRFFSVATESVSNVKVCDSRLIERFGFEKSRIKSAVNVHMMANFLTWLSGFSHTCHYNLSTAVFSHCGLDDGHMAFLQAVLLHILYVKCFFEEEDSCVCVASRFSLGCCCQLSPSEVVTEFDWCHVTLLEV